MTTVLIPIRFADVDSAGIVYYPRYFHFFHVAMEEYIERALGAHYKELVIDRKRGFPAVHVETDFRAPLRYGDTLAVDVEISSMGETSVRWRYTGRRQGEEEVVVRAEVVTVYSDLEALEKRPIPVEIRDRLGGG